MPIYEYICDECQTPYEKLVLSKSEKVSCPKCGSGKKTQQLSTFAAHSGNGAASRGAALRDRSGQASSAPTCSGNPAACGRCSFEN